MPELHMSSQASSSAAARKASAALGMGVGANGMGAAMQGAGMVGAGTGRSAGVGQGLNAARHQAGGQEWEWLTMSL